MVKPVDVFKDLFCPLTNDIEIIQNHPNCERILSANPPVWGRYSISILETETGMLWIDTVSPRLLLVLLQCFCSTSPQQTILLHEIPMIFLLKSHRWIPTVASIHINPFSEIPGFLKSLNSQAMAPWGRSPSTPPATSPAPSHPCQRFTPPCGGPKRPWRCEN